MSEVPEVNTGTGSSSSCNKQKTFVTILAKFPVLLSKSQLPHVKGKKANASDQFLNEYQKQSGVQMTKDQLFKKLNNMKSTVKNKADAKKTGNKPIILTDWEEEFLGLLDAERNPTFSQVPGSISVGLSRKRSAIALKMEADVDGTTQDKGTIASSSSSSSSTPRPTPPPPPKKSRAPTQLPEETEETRAATSGASGAVEVDSNETKQIKPVN